MLLVRPLDRLLLIEFVWSCFGGILAVSVMARIGVKNYGQLFWLYLGNGLSELEPVLPFLVAKLLFEGVDEVVRLLVEAVHGERGLALDFDGMRLIPVEVGIIIEGDCVSVI